MSTRTLSVEEKEFAEACGIDEATYLATLMENELQPGTYNWLIASAKVAVQTRDNVMKDSISANIRLVPIASNGQPAKRFGGVFKNLTLPVENGTYVPNSVSISVGSQDLKALATAGGISMAKLVKDLRAFNFPAELLNKKIAGAYSLRADKNDSSKSWPEVKFSKGEVKTFSNLNPDGGGSAAVAAKPVAESDDSVPF